MAVREHSNSGGSTFLNFMRAETPFDGHGISTCSKYLTFSKAADLKLPAPVRYLHLREIPTFPLQLLYALPHIPSSSRGPSGRARPWGRQFRFLGEPRARVLERNLGFAPHPIRLHIILFA